MRAKNPNPKVRARCEGLTRGKGKWNGKIRLLEENLEKPLHRKKPTTWAVWNDLFHDKVMEANVSGVPGHHRFMEHAFDVMAAAPQHTFLILTKRPENMRDFFKAWTNIQGVGWLGPDQAPWPLPNVWIGVTAENQARANERIPILCQIPAAVRFVSAEPLLGPVDLSRWTQIAWQCSGCRAYFGGPYQRTCPECGRVAYWTGSHRFNPPAGQVGSGLSWVVAGCESGPNARPMHPEWIRRIRDDCVVAGVPLFYKQAMRDGKMVKLPMLDGREWKEFPNV